MTRGESLGHGFRLERHASLPSTNDALRAYAVAGEPAGLFVAAAEQTAGRGRHGRSWSSPPGGNLYASLLLRPEGVSLAEAATLSLVAALAVADALADGLVPDPSRLAVKWPNDVLLDGAKLGGILLEGADDGAGGCAWLIVGMGLNLASSPEGLPYPATSLREARAAAGGEERAAAKVPAPEDFLARLAPPLRRRLDAWEDGGFAAVRADWLARAHGLGRAAALRLGGEILRGRFADLGEDGSILLENELGCLARHSAGELFFP